MVWIRKALEFDARMISLMCYGVQTVWPHKAQMGGYPGWMVGDVSGIGWEVLCG